MTIYEPIKFYNKWKGVKVKSHGGLVIAESYFFYPFDVSYYIKLIKEKDRSLTSTEVWPSSICNQNCSFCSSTKFPYKRGLVLESNKLKTLIIELANLGNKIVRFSGGGEPFMFKKLSEILIIISNNNMMSFIISNGTLINQNDIYIISELCSGFRISFNAGNKHTYYITHGTDHFESVIKKMLTLSNLREKINRRKKLLLGATFIITTENYKSLFQAAKIVKECGFDYFLIRAQNPSRPLFLDEEYDSLKIEVQRCHELKCENFNVSGAIESLSGYKQKSSPNNLPCFASHFRSYINSDGGVYPCFSCIVHQEGVYGNIYNSTFYEIWNRNKHDRLAKNLEKGVLLKNCNKFCTYVKFNTFVSWILDQQKECMNFEYEKIPKDWASRYFI